MAKTKTVAIAVGGTGGHVIPASAIGSHLSEFERVIYLGVNLGNNAYLRQQMRTVYDIDGGNFSGGYFRGLKKISKGYFEAKKILEREQVDHILGWGSYHSMPAIMAALRLGIPYTLVETNVYPGRVNRLFSRWAKATAIHFDAAGKSLKGNLVKMSYDLGVVSSSYETFGLHPTLRTILVFGGSQGASAINVAVVALSQKLKDRFQFIHFTGKETGIREMYQKMGVVAYVAPFSHAIDKAWEACDFAICRAGAGALREMLLFEKPAIMIPFPKAMDGHQDKNALFMEREIGGGLTLFQKDLTPESLIKTIYDIEPKLASMKQSLRNYKNKETRKDLISIVRESL